MDSTKVLDKGHVRLVDVMGDDAAIVQAARVSYGKGTKTVSEDRGLIRYLMRNRHTTPFEMVEFKFHVRVPMDAWRQWIRHRTASVNEYSTRYSEAIEDKQATSPREWRAQSANNKQGSGEFLPVPVGNNLTANETQLHLHAEAVYQDRLQAGVAREQARKDLPLSTYTEAYWKIDLHNLFHFLALRMDSHAQKEIREYANAIAEIVKQKVPLAWEAFEDYRLNGMFLTGPEVARFRGDIISLSAREHKEADAKAERLGLDRIDKAMEIILDNVGIDGAHHKQSALVQALRALVGNDEAYAEVVKDYCDGEDGPETYGWDEGIPA